MITNGKNVYSLLNVESRKMIVQSTKSVKKSSKPSRQIKAGAKLKKTWDHKFVI